MTIHNIHLDSATKQALEQLIALTELWALDDELAQACVVVARWLGDYAIYPSELGYGEALHAIWQRWR
nr:hypothetical protein [uncultured Halomonas sp.]